MERPHADALLARIHQVFTGRRRIDLDTNFFEAGFSSATLAESLQDLRDLGLTVTLVDLYHHPTVRELTRSLAPETGNAGTPPWMR